MSWGQFAIYTFVFLAGFAICYVVFAYLRGKKDPNSNGHSFPRAIGALLVMMAVGAIAQSIYFQNEQANQANEQRRIAECQYRVNATLIQVLNARTDSNDEADQALVDMATAILNAKTASESRAAIVKFIDAANRKKVDRSSNPLPEIPNNCRP